MKKPIIFLLFVCCSLLVQSQPTFTKNEQAVQQTIIKAFDALSNRDSVGLRDQCSADVKFYEYGKTWTIDSMIKLAIATNTAADFKRTNKIDFVTTTINGNIAWATYDLYSDITTNGKNITIHWLETQVLVMEHKRWKIKLLHSTLIKRN